jgi:hypothetical protein
MVDGRPLLVGLKGVGRGWAVLLVAVVAAAAEA